MTMQHIMITQTEFDAHYPLMPNHLNPQADWYTGHGYGCLFETFGEEFEFVRQQDTRQIWTLIPKSEGGHFLMSGLHRENPVGYLVSRSSSPVDTVVTVVLEFPNVWCA